MNVGDKRTLLGRIGAALAFVCGAIGLLAGLTHHSWKLGPDGWFAGGGLLVIIAVFLLVDAALARQRAAH